mmetsp:Transcript_19807/g.50405  ORF Transcript_19807/g.50405 Transcript_19807/m.50405 type:complete len:88 (+) Transcript_19807:136-399(+)
MCTHTHGGDGAKSSTAGAIARVVTAGNSLTPALAGGRKLGAILAEPMLDELSRAEEALRQLDWTQLKSSLRRSEARCSEALAASSAR